MAIVGKEHRDSGRKEACGGKRFTPNAVPYVALSHMKHETEELTHG